jgi:hypothetical protein
MSIVIFQLEVAVFEKYFIKSKAKHFSVRFADEKLSFQIANLRHIEGIGRDLVEVCVTCQETEHAPDFIVEATITRIYHGATYETRV